jgi:hypothetical protein
MAALSALLTSPLALPIALSLLFLYLCLRTIINWRSLRQFPGPLLAKSSRLWLFWQSLRARVNVAQCEALQQYGNYETLQHTSLFPFQTLMHRSQDHRAASVPICCSPTTRIWCAT